MEAKICCANNVSRGCKISSKVTVTDCASTPFKLMKLMLDGLAKDAEAGFWLTQLSQTPQIVRLFPFDFVYLDSDLKILQATELSPEAKLPRFHPHAASALILPLNSLSLSGTEEGDTLAIYTEEEFEPRPAEAATPAIEAIPISSYATPVKLKPFELQTTPLVATPLVSPQISTPSTAVAAQGAGHTLALSTSWQISTSTPAGVLLDCAELEEMEAREERVESVAAPLSELPSVDAAEAKSPKEKESPAAIAIIESEPENQGNTPTIVDSVEDQQGKAQASENAQDENPVVLDTDLTTIFDAAIADELEDGQQLELLHSGNTQSKGTAPSAPDADDAVAGLRTSGDGEAIAHKETRVTGGAKPAATGTREKSPAPGKVIQKNGSTKSERPGTREKVNGTTSVGGSEDSRTRSTGKDKKRSLGYFVKEFLNCQDPLPELRASQRLVQQGMVAYEKSNESLSPIEVRDVSPSGLYLRTRRRWPLRKEFTLTLQKRGASDDDFQSRVHAKVAAVRNDEEGVGLAWVFPKHVKFDPWRRVHTKRSDETDIQFFIREIRLTKALGFLQQICPVAVEDLKHALHERFSNKRVASSVEIALKAEDLLDKNRRVGPVLAHSEVVMRVLENGSWIEEDWIRKMWAGLLVSSCNADGSDKSNLPFLDLMARLTPIHLRILTFVCDRAVQAIAAGQSEAKLELYSTTKELMEAADSHSFQRIQQTIGHLSNFGLLQEVMRPSYAAGDDKARTRTTPTPMGLKMHAHCEGHRT